MDKHSWRGPKNSSLPWTSFLRGNIRWSVDHTDWGGRLPITGIQRWPDWADMKHSWKRESYNKVSKGLPGDTVFRLRTEYQKRSQNAKILRERGPGSEAKSMLGSPRPGQVNSLWARSREAEGTSRGHGARSLRSVGATWVLATVGRWGLFESNGHLPAGFKKEEDKT